MTKLRNCISGSVDFFSRYITTLQYFVDEKENIWVSFFGVGKGIGWPFFGIREKTKNSSRAQGNVQMRFGLLILRYIGFSNICEIDFLG